MLCSLAYYFHFSTLGPAGKICSPSTQKSLLLGQPVWLREKVGRPFCFRSSQHSKPPSDSLVQETKTQRGSVTCLKSHSKLVKESELENRAPDNQRVQRRYLPRLPLLARVWPCDSSHSGFFRLLLWPQC